MSESKFVARVCESLEQRYGSPRHGNPEQPLGVLAYILLSNRTGPKVAKRVYEEFEAAFPDWSGVTEASMVDLQELFRPAGLAEKRSRHFVAIADTLRRRFGTVTLKPLRSRPTDEAEEFLCSLPGVSTKVAKCVLMYGFDRNVLPVDIHVYRITKRLGWHDCGRADQTHDILEAIVSPEDRYGLHVNCIAHGRQVCFASEPDCGRCLIVASCPMGRARLDECEPSTEES